MIKLPFIFLTLTFSGVAAYAQSDDLLAVRWGSEGGTVMEVRGVDDQDRLRLSPTDGSSGEALVPLAELTDLQFVLPESYREARQRAFVGRPAEAVFMLRSVVPAFAPFAHIPNSNAGAAVQFYLALLVDQREWADALALGSALVERRVSPRLLPELIRLVRGLQAEGRIGDAAWLVGRLPLDSEATNGAALIIEVADEMRRAGHWAEAQTIYRRLREIAPAAEKLNWDHLIAYTDWHQGSVLFTGVLVQQNQDDPVRLVRQAGLPGLLQGRHLLAANQPRDALDALSETLIGIAAASEWRTEITAVIADAYEALGEDSKAQMIRIDLRRMHPNSRWVPPVES